MVASFQDRFSLLLLVFILTGYHQLNAQDDLSYYKHLHYKPHLIADLPQTVNETSGLLFFNGQLWTINDSGNQPEIYLLDTTNGNVVRTVVVRNSVNTDWESITQDEANVYIGDFGNNVGNRNDLRILKIPKSDFFSQANDTVNATYIHFLYPDQTHFETALNNHNFDCEAFFFHNDSLHLFSKNRLDLYTKHYILPVEPGNYKARLAESFNADGLITDASINSRGNVVLIGYKSKGKRLYTCFVWVLSGYEGDFYFSGSKRRVELGSALRLGPTEGIVLKEDNTGWLSSESIQLGWMHRPAKLFRFNFGGFLE